jgi:esterase
VLSFSARGSGPEGVLLLHGFLGSGRNLANLARRLSEADPRLTIYSVDLPGHGRSPPLRPDETFDSAADQLLELASQVAKGPCWWIGHSLGGRIGLAALGRAPEQIRRLSLLDIGPSPTTGASSEQVGRWLVEAPANPQSRDEAIEHLTGRGLSRALADWLAMNLESGPNGLGWRIDRKAVLDFHLRTSGTDLWSVAARHVDRLQVIVGGASGYVSEGDRARLTELGAAVTVLPGASHFLHADALEPLVAALSDLR